MRWPGAKAVFVWSAGGQALAAHDGRRSRASSDGKRLGGTTVVIQYVNIHASSYGDKFGGMTPMSETVGSGQGGRAPRRPCVPGPLVPDLEDRRHEVDAGLTGRPLPFAPGQVWVLLANKTTPATLTR